MPANKLKNCPNCGRIFMDTGIGICQDCYQKEIEMEEQVSSYVREHPHTTVAEVVQALGVKERLVMRMIRNGRFLATGIEVTYPCEGCGTQISTGRRCEKCNEKLLKQIEDHAAKKAREAEMRKRRPLGVGMRSKKSQQKHEGKHL